MASRITIRSLTADDDEALSRDDFSRKFVSEYDLKRALNRLTTRERKIMTLIYWKNLTQAQVANSVGPFKTMDYQLTLSGYIKIEKKLTWLRIAIFTWDFHRK